jgi:7-cyano-7-deazaguanine synthase
MKTVIIHSGGLDSTVLLYHLLEQGHSVSALSIHYGQRHARELDCARLTCERLGVAHELADLRDLARVLSGSSLTSNEIAVAEGHYTEETMKSTVVPNRNMILLAVAAGHALSQKADAVAYAAHAGDHAIYPDCRPAFAEQLAQAIALADWQPLELLRPFIEMDKTAIVRRGAELGVPFADTWSCYKGDERHCGRCGTCIERREAFYLAGITDPTVYAYDAPETGRLVASQWRL